jgi:hypothetical protein
MPIKGKSIRGSDHSKRDSSIEKRKAIGQIETAFATKVIQNKRMVLVLERKTICDEEFTVMMRVTRRLTIIK